MHRLRLTPLAADGLMLLAAFIWGVGFILQKYGSELLGAFTFTGLRFLLAALLLVPFLFRGRFTSKELTRGAICGAVMAVAAVFQQWGIKTTTVGNAGFITSMYVVIAPFIALAFGQQIRRSIWMGLALVLPGLWFLSIDSEFAVQSGDPKILACAVAWAVHILLVGRWTRDVDALRFAFLQFAITGVTATALGFTIDGPTRAQIDAAKWLIILAGIFPTCVAFTLQMIAQRTAPATHAAILLSLEAVFAMLAGVLLLSEDVTSRKLTGAALMLAGMIVAQLRPTSASHPAPDGRSAAQ
ncbi:MAG: DMT family transporter [Phycisphaerae bacterium]|nr:DMT family transporter [Phycisphaerae bacterium]